MVAIAQIEQLQFQYALANQPSLAEINLTVNAGDWVVVAGPSGSGKTTLLRQFKRELWPVGQRLGQVSFNGQTVVDLDPAVSAQKIGFVFQNPENQLVMDTVIQELAFSLENSGEASANIQKRIAELVSFLGIQDILYASVHELSGGQKQLVNLAAILILQPSLLVLDEPTAQLDPIATKEFMSLLQRVHDELGITIIMSEHQLDDVLPLANQLWLMTNGHISYQGPVEQGLQAIWQQPTLRDFMPEIPRLFWQQQLAPEPVPLTVVAGQRQLPAGSIHDQLRPVVAAMQETLLTADHLDFQYTKNEPYVLNQLKLTVHTGDWLAIVGKNGIGKSTLLKVLIGLLEPRRGTVRLLERPLQKWPTEQLFKVIGYLSQQPADQFSAESVRVEFERRAVQLGREHPEEAATAMLDKLGLTALADSDPQDTSGGEQQLIALGIILLANPKLLILDEPTKGLDSLRKQALGRLLQQLQAAGLTIIMASHDMVFSARFANQCALLFDGAIVAQEAPHQFFQANFFYTTPINRLLRPQDSAALTWEEVSR
ncbi:ABC transporter ATP-binding protein [Latilactobacillus sakei]